MRGGIEAVLAMFGTYSNEVLSLVKNLLYHAQKVRASSRFSFRGLCVGEMRYGYGHRDGQAARGLVCLC